MTQLTIPVNSNDNSYGNAESNIVLVEYGDYECPYCGKAYPQVKQIKEQLGKYIRIVFRNFPLTKIHPNAFAAAVATEAAAIQGKFWDMHNIIFENQKTLSDDFLIELAGRIDLDVKRFKEDIKKVALIDKVEKDFESGLRSGVNRTPSFFINGEKFEGEWKDDQLIQYLKRILAENMVQG
ncbi:MAG TPA: DsbA family protein [Pseudobacter sp.]|nr:DsbA family protein [Pseudobacter sp.]